MKKISVLLLIISMLVMSGCSRLGEYDGKGKGISANNYPVTVYDVTVSKAPDKVISISPAITEIICEIGFKNKLVGRSDYCTYPEDVKSVESMGSSAKPDLDRIEELKPDVLFTQSPISAMEKHTLEQKKITIITIPAPKSYSELIDVYGAVAKVFRGNNFSDATINDQVTAFNDALTSVSQKNHDNKFVWFISDVGAVATGDTIESNLLSVFGTNVAKEAKQYKADVAQIVSSAPDVVFISKGMTKEMLPPEIIQYIDEKGITPIEIDSTLFERPTSRVKNELIRIDKILDKSNDSTTDESKAE